MSENKQKPCQYHYAACTAPGLITGSRTHIVLPLLLPQVCDRDNCGWLQLRLQLRRPSGSRREAQLGRRLHQFTAHGSAHLEYGMLVDCSLRSGRNMMMQHMPVSTRNTRR